MSTIEKNIKKFEGSNSKLTRHFFEIKSLGKVFVICEVYTENLPGLKQLVNTALRKVGNNTSFADIKHSFEEIGYVQVTATNLQAATKSEFEDLLTEHAIECDAQEVENVDFDGKSATFICRPIDIEKVKRSLLNLKYIVEDSQHIFVPNNVLKLNENEMKVYEILKQKLSQLEGYENIYDNVEAKEATA
jgi:translational activator of cytochrome c oxidase 1